MSISIPAQALFEQWAGMPYNSLDGWEFHLYQADSIIKAIGGEYTADDNGTTDLEDMSLGWKIGLAIGIFILNIQY